MDEIYVKPYYDYKGGSVIGAAFNSEETATSAFVFMISSVMSSFKEVAHIAPIQTIDFNALQMLIKK